jgi:Cys-tRNA(Pro)/Cys-tRNA(Cys) deacylase
MAAISALAEGVMGYAAGGISPLGQRRALPTFVDHSALSVDTIIVSAGRRGLEMELAPRHLISLTSAQLRKLGRGLRCVAVGE